MRTDFQKTIPWSRSALMRVDGIPVVYTAGICWADADVLVHLPGARWCANGTLPAVHPTVTQLRAAGHEVVLPRVWRYEA